MNFAALWARNSGRATPSLHCTPKAPIKETRQETTYLQREGVQTTGASSLGVVARNRSMAMREPYVLQLMPRFNSKQQTFLDFVLSHYLSEGVGELGTGNMTPLLQLKYHDSLADAVNDLDDPDQIHTVFCGFQRYLYLPAA